MTSGTVSSIRNALELSITTQPAFAATGANSLEMEAPALNNPMSIPANASFVSSRTAISWPWNLSFLPSEREDASKVSLPTGKFLFSSVLIISMPTAPVAPMTATCGFRFIKGRVAYSSFEQCVNACVPWVVSFQIRTLPSLADGCLVTFAWTGPRNGANSRASWRIANCRQSEGLFLILIEFVEWGDLTGRRIHVIKQQRFHPCEVAVMKFRWRTRKLAALPILDLSRSPRFVSTGFARFARGAERDSR